MSNEIKTVEVLRDNFAEMVGSNFHALLKNSHDTGEPINFSQAKDALTKDETAIKQQIADKTATTKAGLVRGKVMNGFQGKNPDSQKIKVKIV
ncbi:MAG: hypothetical protein CMP22_01980 [Rickettsiales bacterium]|nr:hypothetical protein [Rickettsiales bacterium]|tara:strand:+ start:1020 stop:1298 length:279 start_codon:yes stop_codon:yes gene_type:complete